MPTPKTQHYLSLLAVLGTLVSCFGCSLAFNNQMGAARIALIVAWLILVPLFVYLIIARRRGKATQSLALQERESQLEKELQALGTVQGVIRAGDQASEETPDVPQREQPK